MSKFQKGANRPFFEKNLGFHLKILSENPNPAGLRLFCNVSCAHWVRLPASRPPPTPTPPQGEIQPPTGPRPQFLGTAQISLLRGGQKVQLCRGKISFGGGNWMTLFPAPQKRGLLRRTTPTAPAIAVKPTAPFLWLGFVRSFVWPATLLLLVPPSLFHCLSWFLVPNSSLPTSGAIRLFAPTCFGMGIGEQKKLPRFGSQSGQNDGGMTEK